MKPLFLRSLYVILPLITTFIPSIAFWLGGYDFNERGVVAVYLFLVSVSAFALGLCWGHIINDEHKRSIVEQ